MRVVLSCLMWAGGHRVTLHQKSRNRTQSQSTAGYRGTLVASRL